MGKTNVPGGWKPESNSGAIVDLGELPGVNAPATNRLMIGSEEAGQELVDTLESMGFEGSDPESD